MSETKRAWKLLEFVGHVSNVNCMSLGHKSSRVMVSGGEDRKVNLWSVGKPNCIMSLTGHTTPVETVRFGHGEEMVGAGSRSGALKVWDLEQAKILRTLTGHKDSIRSLDFHPYGDYAASGSLDCTVKLWDIRRKGCIYTYKGHAGCVNALRFSPDGRWIASASSDCSIKIWDLTAGKLLTDMNKHTAPVNVIEFHPNELLLASGSEDGTIKFWDLETFRNVDSTSGDTMPIRSMCFHPEGSVIFGGSHDLVKVYGWEPARCFDSVPISWGAVSDIAIAQNQLIGTSFSQSNISTHVVDIQRVQPFGGVAHQEGANKPNPPQLSSSRKSFITDRPPTQSSKQSSPRKTNYVAPRSRLKVSRQSSVPKEDHAEPPGGSADEPEDLNFSQADIKNPDEYHQIFQPKGHRLAHSPTRKVEPFPAPVDDAKIPVKQPARKVEPFPAPANDGPFPVKSTKKPDPVRVPADEAYFPVKAAKKPESTPAPVENAPSEREPPRQPAKSTTANNRKPPGLAAEDFLPKPLDLLVGGNGAAVSESDILKTVNSGHKAMFTVLSNRGKNIQIVRAMWTSGNTRTAVDSALSMGDDAVTMDVLNVLNSKSSFWTLDLCNLLLAHLKDFLNSKYESYVIAACNSLKMILKNLGPIIQTNMISAPSIGVDISREERQRKCNNSYLQLVAIREVLEKKQNVTGRLGSAFREVIILIGTLE